MPMRDNKGKKKPDIYDEQSAVADTDGQEVSYTPEQRRLLRNGLRIWARVAIRSYMRQQVGESQADKGPEAEG